MEFRNKLRTSQLSTSHVSYHNPCNRFLQTTNVVIFVGSSRRKEEETPVSLVLSECWFGVRVRGPFAVSFSSDPLTGLR